MAAEINNKKYVGKSWPRVLRKHVGHSVFWKAVRFLFLMTQVYKSFYS